MYDLHVNEGGKQEWHCSFCGTINQIAVTPEELPKGDTVDYILQAPPANASSSDSTALIFCLGSNVFGQFIYHSDISGSMCVSYEMQGKFQLKGDSVVRNSNLNTEHADQYIELGYCILRVVGIYQINEEM